MNIATTATIVQLSPPSATTADSAAAGSSPVRFFPWSEGNGVSSPQPSLSSFGAVLSSVVSPSKPVPQADSKSSTGTGPSDTQPLRQSTQATGKTNTSSQSDSSASSDPTSKDVPHKPAPSKVKSDGSAVSSAQFAESGMVAINQQVTHAPVPAVAQKSLLVTSAIADKPAPTRVTAGGQPMVAASSSTGSPQTSSAKGAVVDSGSGAVVPNAISSMPKSQEPSVPLPSQPRLSSATASQIPPSNAETGSRAVQAEGTSPAPNAAISSTPAKDLNEPGTKASPATAENNKKVTDASEALTSSSIPPSVGSTIPVLPQATKVTPSNWAVGTPDATSGTESTPTNIPANGSNNAPTGKIPLVPSATQTVGTNSLPLPSNVATTASVTSVTNSLQNTNVNLAPTIVSSIPLKSSSTLVTNTPASTGTSKNVSSTGTQSVSLGDASTPSAPASSSETPGVNPVLTPIWTIVAPATGNLLTTNSQALSVPIGETTVTGRVSPDLASSTWVNSLNTVAAASTSVATGSVQSAERPSGKKGAASGPSGSELMSSAGSTDTSGLSTSIIPLPNDQSVTNVAASVTSQLTDTIMQRVHSQSASDHSSVVLRLNPPELGKVDVHVSMSNDVVSIRLVATDESTRQIISGQMNDLRQSLTGQGISVGQFQIDSGSQQSFGQGSSRQSYDMPTYGVTASRQPLMSTGTLQATVSQTGLNYFA